MSSSSEEKVSEKSSSDSEEEDMLSEDDSGEMGGGFMQRMKRSYFFRRIVNKTNIGLFFSMQVIGILMMVYAMLYYGSIWDPAHYSDRLKVYILNEDQGYPFGAVITPNVTINATFLPRPSDILVGILLNSAQTKSLFDWSVLNPNEYSRDDLLDRISDGDGWGAIRIPSTYSQWLFAGSPVVNGSLSLVTTSLSPGLAGYYPTTTSVEFIYDQGRNYATANFLTRVITSVFTSIGYGVATYIKFNLGTNPLVNLLYLSNPFFFTNPTVVQFTNLHEVKRYGENFASYIIFTLMWIGTQTTVLVLATYNLDPGKRINWDMSILKRLHIEHQAARYVILSIIDNVTRFFFGLFATLLQSFLISTVLAIYGAEFGDGFWPFWWWLYYVSLSFLFINATLAMVLGSPFFQLPATFLLILQLTTSGAFISEDQANDFYKIGRGFPFYYGVRGARKILFGSLPEEMVENGFIIFAYLVVFMGIYLILSVLKADVYWHKISKKNWFLQLLGNVAGGEEVQPYTPMMQESGAEIEELDTELATMPSNNEKRKKKKLKKEKKEENEAKSDSEAEDDGDMKQASKTTLAIAEEEGGWSLWLRKRVLGRQSKQTGLLMGLAAVLIFIYALLYIGALWDPASYTDNFRIVIVNADRGFNLTATGLASLSGLPFPSAGSLLMNTLLTNDATSQIVEWQVYPTSTTYEETVDLVNDGQAWGALYIPPGYSSGLIATTPLSLDTIFDVITNPATVSSATAQLGQNSQAIDYIYDEARNANSNSILLRIIKQIFATLNQQVRAKILNSSILGALLLPFISPVYLQQPFTVNYLNLHPVAKTGENFASYVSIVLTYMASMMTIMTITTKTVGDDRAIVKENKKMLRKLGVPKKIALGLAVGNRIFFRCFIVVCYGFLATLCIALPLAYYGASFDIDGGFMAYWMWLWYVSLCFLPINGALAALIGAPAFQLPSTFFMILQIASGGSVLSEYSMNNFFTIGHAFPFYWAVRGTRVILFGTQSDFMYRNAMVIFGWGVGAMLVFVLASAFRVVDRVKQKERDNLIDRIFMVGSGSKGGAVIAVA